AAAATGCETVVDEPEQAADAAARPIEKQKAERDTRFMTLWNDRELGGLHLERLELARASLRILGRYGVAHDSHGGVVGHHPLGDPELALRLPIVLPITHWKIDRLAGEGEVNHEFRRAVAFAGRRVDGVHAKTDRLASLELIVQEAIFRLARRVEVDDV